MDGSLQQPQMFTVSNEKLQFCPMACKFENCHRAWPVRCMIPQDRAGETTMLYVKSSEISLHSTVSPLVVIDTHATSLTREGFAEVGKYQLTN